MTIIHPGFYCSMIEWCFTPLSTVFQLYHGNCSRYSCLSWVSPVLSCGSECLALGHSHEKTQRIQCGSNPGPLDYESNTLPLSHAGPLKSILGQTKIGVWLLVDYFKNITIIFFVILLSKMTFFVL